MYRVFLSYNTQDEMTVVWRLQTLAAASGLHLDVPSPAQRANFNSIRKMIDDADSVIVFLTAQPTSQVNEELAYALKQKRPVIPIVERGTTSTSIEALLQHSGVPVFELDARYPWQMERKLADYLAKKKVGKDARNAILALAGTFIGLFLLDKLSET
jgi:hypothetical protein